MDPIEEIIREMCASYHTRCTPELVEAFRRAVNGLDIDVVRSAARRWVDEHPKKPTPKDLRDSCRSRGAPKSVVTAIVCQDCGERVEGPQIERHADTKDGWCEVVVRRRIGDPPIDRYLVHLRGLANALGTPEARKNLQDYLASRVPAKAGILQESF